MSTPGTPLLCVLPLLTLFLGQQQDGAASMIDPGSPGLLL